MCRAQRSTEETGGANQRSTLALGTVVIGGSLGTIESINMQVIVTQLLTGFSPASLSALSSLVLTSVCLCPPAATRSLNDTNRPSGVHAHSSLPQTSSAFSIDPK